MSEIDIVTFYPDLTVYNIFNPKAPDQRANIRVYQPNGRLIPNPIVRIFYVFNNKESPYYYDVNLEHPNIFTWAHWQSISKINRFTSFDGEVSRVMSDDRIAVTFNHRNGKTFDMGFVDTDLID